MSSLLRLIFSPNSSLILRKIAELPTVAAAPIRYISLTPIARSEPTTDLPEAEKASDADAAAKVDQNTKDLDRTKVITLEESLRYLASDAYKQTYGDKLVFEQYRRNHKGGFAPRKTRKTCVRKGMISTGNPCPICRDEYLLLDHRNLELLKQFISPHTGEILSYSKTGVCQKKHQQLVIAIERAMDQGLITFDVPFRKYDYAEYYDTNKLSAKAQQSN